MMKEFIRIAYVVILLMFISCVYAEVQKINVGHGVFVKGSNHWVKEEPKDRPFNLELIPTGNIKIKKGEIIAINVKVKNVSLYDQQIDFSNVRIEIHDKAFKNIISSMNMEPLGTLNLKRGTSEVKKFPMEIARKIDQPGEYVVWAYYNLPDDKGINSNDLEITITP